MEDFDEAEEMNEEDLVDLGDSFAQINLKVRGLRGLIYCNCVGTCAEYSE
jgi:hypothetical protein